MAARQGGQLLMRALQRLPGAEQMECWRAVRNGFWEIGRACGGCFSAQPYKCQSLQQRTLANKCSHQRIHTWIASALGSSGDWHRLTNAAIGMHFDTQSDPACCSGWCKGNASPTIHAPL
jgi:hypothetical protein